MKHSALVALKLLVSVALLAYLFSGTDLAALEARVRSGDLVLLVLAMAIYAAIVALATWRWHLLLTAQGFPARLSELSASYLVASFFNNFLPSNIGGDVIRVRDSAKVTGSTTTSLAVVAIDRILGLAALYALALGGYLLGGDAVRDLVGAREVVLVLGLLFGGLTWVFFRPGIARRLMAFSGLSRMAWARDKFDVVQAAVHVYRQEVREVWLAFAGSIALQALVVL
jgi:uncharacterized protein (TIRG00374 family)